ncbi:methyltransferase domain-containing protein [Micromonospora sp. R77]|uniref:class I SAM-dependent methyltransferase n=1 Tax=Micromonospora sp. R77 TaxID=2925836 RepID=UPI001F6044FB|nr:methyltransferase domain-containing protein [Micromonospora sp. R77]MCI4062082.1 methyltransferase domain-containing protein [Micromonospora sp. R77]
MSNPPDPTFEPGLDAWRDWQEAPWGRLRYAQAEANLARHLPAAPARILDLAGGDGADAVRLAGLGHHVTIVDNTPGMLAAARSRFAEAGLADRVRLVEADVTATPAHLGGDAYDVVLCHNLIQYLSDPAAMIATARRAVRLGGSVSVMAINPASEPLFRATRDLDPAAALAALDADEAMGRTFGITVRHWPAERVAQWLTDSDCRLVGHYGIRAVNDYVRDNERKQDPEFFDALLRLELALSDRMPYPLIARFYHLIAEARHDGPGRG